MKLLLSALLCGSFLFLDADVRARYIRPDLEKVPVERLVQNLEEQAGKEPKNAQVRFNLARLHGMAFAQKAEDVEVWRGKIEQGAWFGHEPAFVPFRKLVVATKDEDKLKAARAHLEKAIAAYKDALKLQPELLAAQLGLAWCTEQSGDKAAAIAAYRKTVESGWAKDKDKKFGPLGGHFITKEAADYLVPLLDAEKDRDEIAELKQRSAQLMKLPRPITPIAIPLADGLSADELLDPRARVAFDADGTGLSQRWTWITPKAAWLVMDRAGGGKITSGLQLFGNVSFWLFWDNGYQALAALDDNNDGELTGPELTGLALWHDANGNGVSDPGEVRPLSAYGIIALSCRGETSTNPNVAAAAERGVRFSNGATRGTFDLILQRR